MGLMEKRHDPTLPLLDSIGDFLSEIPHLTLAKRPKSPKTTPQSSTFRAGGRANPLAMCLLGSRAPGG